MFDFRADDVVGNIAPRPLLLIHAAKDSVTPTEQSIEMFKRAGQPTELHLFCGSRPLPVLGELGAGVGHDEAVARQVFPGGQMTGKSIAVSHEELGRFIREVLMTTGAREKDAAIVAEGLVWANLRGGDGHGVSRLPRYLKIIEHGEIDRKAEPRLSHDRAATFVLDCGHGFGPVAVMQAAALAVERAKKTGVCFGLVRETTHTGAIGRYAQWIAERDCAAIIIGAGPTLMAYHGARVASLSTSPIAIAVPSGNGPIVLDMATSAVANGKILQGRATGNPLPENTVLTAEGEPTTDPQQGRNPVAARRPEGVRARLDVRNAGERACRGADPGACARSGKAHASHRQHRDARYRYRNIPAARRFHQRCRCAGGHHQSLAAAGGLRRNQFAGRALAAHRGRAPQDRHPDPGEALGRA